MGFLLSSLAQSSKGAKEAMLLDRRCVVFAGTGMSVA